MRIKLTRRAVGVAAMLAILGAGCAVTPTYRSTSTTFEGFPVISSVPPHPKGIVFLFHGTGGGANFATKIETIDTLNHLTRAGYGFVSTESTNRSSKQWDTGSLSLTGNPDLARLSRLHAQLVSSGAITSSTPIYAVGMSRGAGFASVFAQGFENAGHPVAAIAPSHGPIPIAVRASGGLTVPASFSLGANDQVVDNNQVVAEVHELQRRGVPAEIFIEAETNLSPVRFLRVPGIDGDTANATFSTLIDAGLWSSEGRRLVSIAKVSSTLPTLHYPSSVTGGQREMLFDEINVVMATHQYSATYAAQTVSFFDAHR
jgi:hypothetical protein